MVQTLPTNHRMGESNISDRSSQKPAFVAGLNRLTEQSRDNPLGIKHHALIKDRLALQAFPCMEIRHLSPQVELVEQ